MEAKKRQRFTGHEGSDPVLRPNRACSYLDISRATLYRLVQAGKLPPPLKLSTQACGWRLSVLNNLLSNAEEAQ